MDKISVIVPVYKVEKELARCVESLLRQDYADFEIILVDDGSPDRSGQIADSFAESYPDRIHVIHQENKGLSGARNTGIRAATGQYLSFVDSDDFVEPNMFSVLMEQLKEADADIAVCGRFDDYPDHSKNSFTMDVPTSLSAEETIRRILTWNQLDIAAWDKLYKAQLWEGVSFPEGINNEDMQRIPEIVRKASTIVHVGQPLYHYCHRENSITTTYNEKKIKDFFKAIQCVETFIRSNYPSIQDELVYYLNHSYLALLLMCSQICYRGHEEKVAKAYLKKNWKNSFSLKKMSKREKLVHLMLRFHLYCVYKKAKQILKKGK